MTTGVDKVQLMTRREIDFGSAFEFIRNGMNVKQDNGAGGLPITRIETISGGYIDPAKVGYAGLSEKGAARWLLKPGDILFSHINSFEHVGKIAVFRGELDQLVHGMNLLCLRPKRDVLDVEYAKHLLRTGQFRARLERFINKAVNQASVSIGNLSSIQIVLPSLEEQRQVAGVLDKAEALRTKRRATLDLLDELPRSIFLDIFGDPVSNPKGFQTGSLFDVSSIVGGGTPSRAVPEYFQGDISWATSKDIKHDELHDTEEHVTSEAIAKSATKLTPPGTILVVVKSKILARKLPLAVSKIPVCFGQDLKGIVPHKPGVSLFCLYALRLSERWLLERARGVNTEGLTLEHLRELPYLMPPENLQQDFVRRVEAIQKVKAAHNRAHWKSDVLFASLQYRVFGGKTPLAEEAEGEDARQSLMPNRGGQSELQTNLFDNGLDDEVLEVPRNSGRC